MSGMKPSFIPMRVAEKVRGVAVGVALCDEG